MKQHLETVKNIVLSVIVQRIAGYVVDQYVMPQLEKLPSKRSKSFGFTNASS